MTPRRRTFPAMRTGTATTHVDADPQVVLDLLTDTDAVRRWAPVPFDLEDPTQERLVAGSQVRVSGSLVGRRVGFEVRVHEAGDGRLALTAVAVAGAMDSVGSAVMSGCFLCVGWVCQWAAEAAMRSTATPSAPAVRRAAVACSATRPKSPPPERTEIDAQTSLPVPERRAS